MLEAFGNTRTVMNANATRFSQVFSVDFDHSGVICSASVQVNLSEISPDLVSLTLTTLAR